jgi:branched-chain amino acid transport system permease protein
MRTGVVVGVIAAVVGLILVLGWGDAGGPNGSVVIGLFQGAAYGLLAVGLVLVYKGTRVFNFAAGEFGTLAAFIAFLFIHQWKVVPYGLGVLFALIAITLLGLFMERVIVRPLMNAPRVTLLVATIAFGLLLVGIELFAFRPEPKNLHPLVQAVDQATGQPVGPELAGYFVSPQEMIIVGVVLVLAVALGWFFSKTDLGLAILATSQDAFATRVVGVGVDRTSQLIWGMAAFLGALAGLLYVPAGGALAPGVITLQTLIPAFTAAVIGGMTSLPGAFVGGIVVGLLQQLALWASGHYYLGDQPWQQFIPGSADVAVFAALLFVLLARPQGLLGTEA